MKVKGYAGRKPEKSTKHEAWAGVFVQAGFHVVNGVIKPMVIKA